MFDIIFLLVNFSLFVLSFIFIIRDIFISDNQMEDAEKGKIPKFSRYSILFALLTMISLVIVAMM